MKTIKTLREHDALVYKAANAYRDNDDWKAAKWALDAVEIRVKAKLKPLLDKAVADRDEFMASMKRDKKPRWPENTPEHVVAAGKLYFGGTEEFHKFRIHAWNDERAVLSWPAGGYSTNGGWNKTQAHYFAISLKEKAYNRPKSLENNGLEKDGRVTKQDIQDMIDGKVPQPTKPKELPAKVPLSEIKF